MAATAGCNSYHTSTFSCALFYRAFMATNGSRVKEFLWYKKIKMFKKWKNMHLFKA